MKRFLWFVMALYVSVGTFAAAPPTSPYKINSAADINPNLNLTLKNLTVTNALSLPLNKYQQGGSTATFYGDSYTAASPIQNSPSSTPPGDVTSKWPTLLCAALSWTCTDTAVGGSQLVELDQMNPIIAASISATSQSFILTDFNGRDEIGTDATKLGYWEDAFTVAALNLTVPTGANKIPQNSSSITYSGTWADTSNYGGTGHEKASSSVGDYAEYTGYFSDLYVGLSRDVSDWGGYQITLDGADYDDGDCQATWTSGGGTAVHPSSHYPFARLIHAATGAHTVRITVVASSGSGKVYLNKLWIPTNATTRTGPYLYVGTPARVVTYPTSAPYNQGSDAANGAMTDIIKRVVGTLASYGLGAVLVNTDQLFIPSTMVGPDNIHPNQLGHTTISNAFYNVITGGKQPQAQTSSTGALTTDSAGNFALGKPLTITGAPSAFGLNVLTSTLSKGISVLSTATLGAGSGGGLWAGTSHTPTAGSQRIGGTVYYSNDGTNLYTPATMYAYSDSEGWNGSAQGSMFVFNLTTPGTVGLHEAARLKGNGNLGLGNTTVPQRISVSDGGVRIDTLAVPSVGSFAAALAGAGAGNVDNGAHNYRVTYVNPAGETTYSTGVSATVTDKTTDGKVFLTAIPVSTSSTVTARNIYRTVAAGSSYKFLATISDNTTTTYTDNIADSSLGAVAPLTNTAGGNLITATGTALQLAGQHVGIHTDGSYDLSLGNLTVGSSSTATGEYITNTTAPGASSGGGMSLGMNALADAADRRIGSYSFHGWTGAAYVQPVAIRGFSAEAWTAGSALGSYLTLSTTPVGSATLTEAVRVTSAQQVGIGTTSTALTSALTLADHTTSAGGLALGTTTPVTFYRTGANAATIAASSGLTLTGGLTLGSQLTQANGGTGLNAAGTANQLLGENSGASALEYKTLSGTSNQVTVTHGTGTITLATPQSIATSSTPQFARLGLGAAAHATAPLLVSTAGAAGIRSISTTAIGSGSGGGFIFEANAQPTANGNRVGALSFGADDGSNLYTPLKIEGWASEAWDGTHNGGYITVKTTPTASVTAAEVARFDTNGFSIGGGTTMKKVLSASGTLDFPSTNSGSSSDLTITVSGAAAGDVVAIGVPAMPAGACSFVGWVSSSNTVSIRFNNFSGGALDPASGTFRAQVTQF